MMRVIIPKKRSNYLIMIFILNLLSQFGCVSKQQLTIVNKTLETTSDSLKIQRDRNYLITIELIKLKQLFLEHLRNDSLKINNSTDIEFLNNTLVSFPNPPPQPSARYTFDQKLFLKCTTYQDVNTLIVDVLNKSGYSNKYDYFLFDDGFVIATDMEQINVDGGTKSDLDRWFKEKKSDLSKDFSIKKYFNALFTAQPGYYRSFVFIISPSLYSFSNESYSKELYSKYLSQGAIGLPPKIGINKLSSETRVHVLIYDFKKPENSSNAYLITDGVVSGYEQLKKANIIKNISHAN